MARFTNALLLLGLGLLLCGCPGTSKEQHKPSTVVVLDPSPAAQTPLIGASCKAYWEGGRITFQSGDTVTLPRQNRSVTVHCRGARWSAEREAFPFVYLLKDAANPAKHLEIRDYLMTNGGEYADTIVLLVGKWIVGDDAERLRLCEGMHPTVGDTLRCLELPLKP